MSHNNLEPPFRKQAEKLKSREMKDDDSKLLGSLFMIYDIELFISGKRPLQSRLGVNSGMYINCI